MGKVTEFRLAKEGDLALSSGQQVYSVQKYKPYSTTTPASTDGGTPANSLPSEPTPGQYKNEEDFLEAKARWGETVGRIKAMAARSSKNE